MGVPSFALAFLYLILAFHTQAIMSAAEEKPCGAVSADINKRQFAGIAVCSKSMKFKNGKDKAKKQTCILKCVLKREGILDDEGQMPIERFDAFLVNNAPPSLIDKANTTFRPCLQFSEKGMDNNDELCKEYNPFIQCLLNKLPELCK